MKVKSTIELNYSAGRQGVKKGIIEITISSYKNTDAKNVNISISDLAVDNTVQQPLPGGIPGVGYKYITQSSELLSYDEYDALLLSVKESGEYTETGTELEDVLLHDYLVKKVIAEKWYNSAAANWVKI